LFPPPLEIRKSSGFPHFHSYYGGGGGGLEASPNPQRPKVGQIKPPKWAKRTCQTQLRHGFLIVPRQMQGQSQIHVGTRIVWEGPRQIPVNRDSLLEILCLHQLLPALRFGRK